MPKPAKTKLNPNYPLSPVNREIALSDYQPHPRNYNKHPARQIERIAGSLQMFGQVRSVVVWRNYFLAGHGVREAALALGWTTLRADVLPDEYPEELALAYVAADNELSRLSDPDQAQLAELLSEAKAYDEKLLAAIGYDESEFQQLLQQVGGLEPGGAGGDAEPQIDRAEELRQKWGVQTGQLWALGEHRLICGDCTDPDVVARVMGGEKADMVWTDPPYNFGSENDLIAADVSRAMRGLKLADWDRNFDLLPALETIPLAENVTAYICTSHHLASVVWGWMATWADHYSWCIWNKPNPMPSLMKRHWTWNAELIPYATRGKHIFNFPAEGHALCVWTLNKHKETEHPTEKPVELSFHAIVHSSTKGAVVYDGFAGSGTTGVACEQLGRKCRMVEIDPKYCAVILERLQTHTGIEPRLING